MVEGMEKVLGLTEEDREQLAEEVLLVVLALHSAASRPTGNNGGLAGNMTWGGSTSARKEA